MIKKQDSIIVREQFGVEFHYREFQKKGMVFVYRINSDDLLQKIKFFGKDRLKTKQQFADTCTVWCDQNAA